MWVPDEDGTPDSPAKKPDLQRLGSAEGVSPTVQGDEGKVENVVVSGSLQNCIPGISLTCDRQRKREHNCFQVGTWSVSYASDGGGNKLTY